MLEIKSEGEAMVLLEDHAALTLNGFVTQPDLFPCIGIVREVNGQRVESFAYEPAAVASFAAMEGGRTGSCEGLKRLMNGIDGADSK